MNKGDLEERLISFAVLCFIITNEMLENRTGVHMAGQLIRSSSSPALNYGEAQSGESKKDFIHKMKIALKELRESHICLQIIYRAKLYKSEMKMKEALLEANELVSIFVKSISTAERNMLKG